MAQRHCEGVTARAFRSGDKQAYTSAEGFWMPGASTNSVLKDISTTIPTPVAC